MENLILIQDNQMVTTSKLVAEVFEKEHKVVLRSIKNLVEQNCTTKTMFKEATFENRGKQYPMYYINRDGFSLLAMGFTGDKALQWKLEFIKAFNMMEEKLKLGNVLSDEEKYKLMLFSKNPKEVAYASNKLVELATKPLIDTICKQEEEIEIMKPKVSYVNNILNNTDTFSTTQIAQDYGYSARKFNEILKEYKIQFKQSNQWILYSKYKDKGYVQSETMEVGLNKKISIMVTKWTQKGRLFLYQFLKENDILPLIEQADFDDNN